MATTWTDVAAAISASVLNTATDRRGQKEASSTSAPLCTKVNLNMKSTELLPLGLRPQQVGSKDYSDVAGSHLINLTVLSQFSQELHQIPETETPITLTIYFYHKLLCITAFYYRSWDLFFYLNCYIWGYWPWRRPEVVKLPNILQLKT